MEGQQNSTIPQPKTDSTGELIEDEPLLSTQQLLFIDYKAVGGWLQDSDDRVPKKMSMQEFADIVQVDRTTLYNWQKNIPDFWARVAKRRKEIGSQERLAKVHDTFYLKALKGEFQHMQLWLANFDPNFRMPAQKVEHELGDNWAALARARLKPGNNERKMIDAEPTNNPS
jgi:hypothetical protein